MRYNHKIPAVLEPTDTLCVKVYIPAHPDYVALFVRAVRMLEINHQYERDSNLSAITVVEQWRARTVTPLIEELSRSTGFCQDLDADCIAYAPFADFIAFTPQNPYTEPDLIPDGYLQPPFFINGKDNSHDLPQYNHGDVLLDIGSISLETGFDLSNAPQIDFCVEGSGIAEIHLLSIALGGVAIITVDNPPDIIDIIGGIISDNLLIVDLNQDLVSFPPETAKVIIQEIEVNPEDDELEHHIYITYLPNIDDSLIPVRFGGGFRKIELCGTLRPCGQTERDINMATVEEICEAVICALEKSASRFLSGTVENVKNDVRVGPGAPPEIIPDVPIDDPLSSLDNQARAGGSYAVYKGFAKMIEEINGWIVDGVPASEINFYLGSKYAINSDMLAAITAYIVDFNTPPTDWTTPVIPASLAEYIYCKGNRRNTIARFIIDIYDAEIGDLLALNNGLEQAQLDEWYAYGEQVPSLDYFNYPCVPIPTEEFTIPLNDQITPNGTAKINHRFRYTASGSYTDVDGDLQDAWYFVPSGGNPVFRPSGFRTDGASFISFPTAAELPYRSDHVYIWTIDILGTQKVLMQWNKDAGMDAAASGTLEVMVKDLGELVP